LTHNEKSLSKNPLKQHALHALQDQVNILKKILIPHFQFFKFMTLHAITLVFSLWSDVHEILLCVGLTWCTWKTCCV